MLPAVALLLALSRLTAAPITPEQVVSVGGGQGIACTTLSRAEMRARGTRGVSMTLCLELFRGEVLGHINDKAGRTRCVVFGVFDAATRCATVTACGPTMRTCL